LSYYRPKGFGGFSVFPPVIKNLLLINGVVFFIQVIGENISAGSGMRFSDVLTKYFALIPLGGIDIPSNLGTIFEQWTFLPWQLITYQFMHGSFSHILFNLFALWMFGMEIENLWGSKKFIYFYLLCGVVAGLFQLFLTPLLGIAVGPTIGASGAVFGILIAFAMLFPDRQIYLYFLIPVRAKYLIGFLIVLNILWLNEPGNVAYLAHLGGAFAGFLFIMFDKTIDAPFKRTIMNLRSGSSGSNFSNAFSDLTARFRGKDRNIEDAKYYDIDNNKDESVSQAEIDRILDKISQSGYQNLSEKEKKILFEASKKMN
jgi:membrane associated rhomboid family serine protease